MAVRARESASRTSSVARAGRPSQKPIAKDATHQIAATRIVVVLPSRFAPSAVIAPSAVASAPVTKTVTRSRSV